MLNLKPQNKVALMTNNDKQIQELEFKISVIKEQEAVAKEQKDLGFLRFLVDQRNKTQDEVYTVRLNHSIALKQQAKEEVAKVAKKAPKLKSVDNGN